MDANNDFRKPNQWQRVSIHAPVMDAKDWVQVEPPDDTVSIHAPVMDAKWVLMVVDL